MRVTIDRVRLGEIAGVTYDVGTNAWAIVLPGAGYSAEAPLLWYARLAATAADRSVLVVTDAFDRARDEPLTWAETRAQAALDFVRGRHDRRPVLIAKSLTSLAADLAAREHLPGIWLTPLIGAGATSVAAEVVSGLRAATEPSLLIGGSADDTWDRDVAASVRAAQIVELPDADHALEIPGDVARSLSNLREVTDALRQFLIRLA